MKNRHLLVFLLLICFSLNGTAQDGFKYMPDMSAKKKGTKSKQLENMNGSIEKVTLVTQKNNSVEIDIHLEGYEGKHLKVFALSKSGSRILAPITPYLKKVSSGKKKIKARLNLVGDNPKGSNFIEVAFTNGALRFKGVSYVYEFKKQWTPKDSSSSLHESPITDRPSQIVELELKPVGTARRFFNQ